MKKTLKLLALTFVISMLVIGTGIMVSANSTAPEMSIDYCNLSFRDSICIKYAVATTSTEETTILLWDEPSNEYLYGTHIAELETVGNQTINGETYKVFDYTGLAAKQMTDVVYARAYTVVDGEEYYSDVEKYSILQYAYNKLGKTATASTDANLKTLLASMLEYGANAQNYFEYSTDRLATYDFYQVKVEGGLIDDMCNHGLYLEGDKVNVIAPETDSEGVAFAGWINEDGDVVAETAKATITVGTSNDVYTAVYGEIPVDPDKPVASEGLEYESNGDGTCYLIGMGDCGDTDVVIPETSPDGDTVFAIDRNAFASEAITSVTIPTTIEEIGRNAFNGCSSLTDVYYLGTEAEWEALCENVATGNTALLNANIHFAKESVTYDEPTIVVESVTAGAGDTVDVTISIANNPGISSLKVSIEYDEKLVLDNVTFTSLFGNQITAPQPYTNPQNISMMSPLEDIASNGTFAILTFDVSGLETGDVAGIALTYDQGNTFDSNFTNVVFDVVNGAISK